MMQRQALQRPQMAIGNRDQLEFLIRHDLLEIFEELKFPESALDRNLPEASNTDGDLVLRDSNFAGDFFRKSERPVSPPEKSVGVEKEPHSGPSNNSVISS